MVFDVIAQVKNEEIEMTTVAGLKMYKQSSASTVPDLSVITTMHV